MVDFLSEKGSCFERWSHIKRCLGVRCFVQWLGDSSLAHAVAQPPLPPVVGQAE